MKLDLTYDLLLLCYLILRVTFFLSSGPEHIGLLGFTHDNVQVIKVKSEVVYQQRGLSKYSIVGEPR